MTTTDTPKKQKTPVTSSPAGGTFATLETVLQRLCDILERENDILDHRRPRELMKTAKEKEALAETYDVEMRAIAANPGLMAAMGPAERAGLKKLAERFRDLLDAHARKLVAVRSVSEEMIRTIAEEAGKRQRPASGYGRNADSRHPANRPPAIAVNTSA